MKVADLFAALSLKPDKASFDAGNALITGIKGGLAAIAAWKGLEWAKSTIENVVELGSHISDLSQQVGVGTEDLQEYGYVAQLAGGSMDSLGNNLGKLAKKAFDASKGNKAAAESFRRIGVNIKGADGELRPAGDILEDIADHIASMPDGVEKTATAMDLFGRSGKEAIPMLNQGGAAIREQKQELADLGALLNDETVGALEAFGDQQDKVKIAVQGLKNQAVVALLPQLRQMVDAFLKWVKVNRELIKIRLQQVLQGVITAVRLLINLFDILIRASVWLAKEWRFVSLVLAGLAGAMLAFKVASVEAALASAAAWLVALEPFLLIGAAIAAVALIAEDIWTWSEGGESVIGDIHQALVDMFVKAIEFWVEKAKAFFDWFEGKWKELRSHLPEFLGGMSTKEAQQFWAESMGASPGATWNDPSLQGVDFFSPEFDRRALALDKSDAAAKAAAPSKVEYHVSANFNLSGVNDPVAISRAVEHQFTAILRQAHAAATPGE